MYACIFLTYFTYARRSFHLSHARVGIVGSAVACATVHVTVAGQARFRCVRRNAVRPVIADLAFLAVDTGRMLLKDSRIISRYYRNNNF